MLDQSLTGVGEMNLLLTRRLSARKTDGQRSPALVKPDLVTLDRTVGCWDAQPVLFIQFCTQFWRWCDA